MSGESRAVPVVWPGEMEKTLDVGGASVEEAGKGQGHRK